MTSTTGTGRLVINNINYHHPNSLIASPSDQNLNLFTINRLCHCGVKKIPNIGLDQLCTVLGLAEPIHTQFQDPILIKM